MMDDYVGRTSSYLLNTRSVLYAAHRLKDSLDSSADELEFAVAQLEYAAKQQENSGKSLRTLAFAQMETETEAEESKLERITEDSLATILTDMQIGNLLIASEETIAAMDAGKKADSWDLDTALQQLDNTAYAIERSLNIPLDSSATPGRFGFAGEIARRDATKSANLSSAIDAFRTASDDTLSALAGEAQNAMVEVMQELSKIDSMKVLEAISGLGCQIQGLPRIGRLLRIGIRKLEEAVNALISLLGIDSLAKIKDKAKSICDNALKGKYTEQLLAQVLGIDDAKEFIRQKLASEDLNKDSLDMACDELLRLNSKFKDSMGMIRGLVATLGLASLLLTPIFGLNGVLFVASAYAIIVGGIILIGRDYTDSGDFLRRVHGVGMIAKSL